MKLWGKNQSLLRPISYVHKIPKLWPFYWSWFCFYQYETNDIYWKHPMTMYIKIINVYHTYTIMYILNMDSAAIYFCTTFTPESLETYKIYHSCMCLPVHIFKTIYWGNFNIILLLNIDLSFPSVALFEFSFSFISLMFFV